MYSRTERNFVAGLCGFIIWLVIFVIGGLISWFAYIDQSTVTADRTRFVPPNSTSKISNTGFFTDLIGGARAEDFFTGVIAVSTIVGIAVIIIIKLLLKVRREPYP
jgi:hypothetical protein